ncbi:MAG: pantetheine-phosphate adenylyltransferase [Clostridiales bacterium]|nr:pantetheine-phosphate adenylyltransferase [Clostridiales bacterium]
MLKAVYPGSFDPVTIGHLDIIERSAKLFDELVVGVLNNPNKKYLFTAEERKQLLSLATSHIPNVRVEMFDGLLVDFAKANQAKILVRGLRAVTDFEDEFQRALINRSLDHNIETIFISANEKHLFLSSSAVKEVAAFGGNIELMVPKEIKQFVLDKFKK